MAPTGTNTQPGFKTKDISTAPIEHLSWSTNDIVSSLSSVCQSVEDQADSAIKWYYARKKPKAAASRTLRLLAIGFATLGGLIPIILNLPYLKAEWMLEKWGYVLIGIAAACIGLDKFFGLSTGWVRYITTAQTLQNDLYTFRMDWARAMSKLVGNTPTSGQLDELLELAKAFSNRIMQTVTQETQQWVVEFQSSLADLEKSTKTQLENARPGALTVNLENAAMSEQPVAVDVDGVSYGSMSGSTWAVRQLAPGVHTVVVSGRKGTKVLQEAGTAVVPPGGTTKLDLKFAA